MEQFLKLLLNSPFVELKFFVPITNVNEKLVEFTNKDLRL